jgi:hypothetical protein
VHHRTARRLVLAILLVAGFVPPAAAQSKMAAFLYTVSVPGPTTRDYVSRTSFQGLGFTARIAPRYRSRLMVGMTLGWQKFEENTTGTVVKDTTTLSGDQLHRVNAFPVLVTVHYYYGSTDSWRVFVGAGAGAVYVRQRLRMTDYDSQYGVWHADLAPELGLLRPLGSADFYISGRYNYGFKAGRSVTSANEALDWDYWTVDVGVAWAAW